jgi:hypothetical protein
MTVKELAVIASSCTFFLYTESQWDVWTKVDFHQLFVKRLAKISLSFSAAIIPLKCLL